MSDAVAKLNAAIARLRRLADPTEFAPEVATALREELQDQIARGVGPDGKPWQPTAAGKLPLRGAASALRVVAVGSRIVASIGGKYAYHHRGQTRGNVARPILPSRALSAPMKNAIKAALAKRFGKIMSGGE